MKQQVFSFKKGQKVPSWVQYLSGGNSESDDCICVFGSNGKLFVLDNGDIVSYPSRERDRFSSAIYINNAVGVRFDGAGRGCNVFYWFSRMGTLSPCANARKVFGIKNTTKTKPIPLSDPRL